MLTDANVRRINDKIKDKLVELDSIFSDSEKKEETRKDLIVLVDLLRIYETPKTQSELSSPEDLIEMLRRRP